MISEENSKKNKMSLSCSYLDRLNKGFRKGKKKKIHKIQNTRQDGGEKYRDNRRTKAIQENHHVRAGTSRNRVLYRILNTTQSSDTLGGCCTKKKQALMTDARLVLVLESRSGQNMPPNMKQNKACHLSWGNHRLLS